MRRPGQCRGNKNAEVSVVGIAANKARAPGAISQGAERPKSSMKISATIDQIESTQAPYLPQS